MDRWRSVKTPGSPSAPGWEAGPSPQQSVQIDSGREFRAETWQLPGNVETRDTLPLGIHCDGGQADDEASQSAADIPDRDYASEPSGGLLFRSVVSDRPLY